MVETRRHTTDDGRPTTDDGRRTTPWVWHKLPTGELTRSLVYYFCLRIPEEQQISYSLKVCFILNEDYFHFLAVTLINVECQTINLHHIKLH